MTFWGVLALALALFALWLSVFSLLMTRRTRRLLRTRQEQLDALRRDLRHERPSMTDDTKRETDDELAARLARLSALQQGLADGSIDLQLPTTARPENFPTGETVDVYDVTKTEVEVFAHPHACGCVIRYGIRAIGWGELVISVRAQGGQILADTECLNVDAITAILRAAAPQVAQLLHGIDEEVVW